MFDSPKQLMQELGGIRTLDCAEVPSSTGVGGAGGGVGGHTHVSHLRQIPEEREAELMAVSEAHLLVSGGHDRDPILVTTWCMGRLTVEWRGAQLLET